MDNVLISQVALPTLNGTVGDITSLQTGPSQGIDALGWAPVVIMLAADQTLTISYKNSLLFSQIIGLAPITGGQLVIAGRTGGANSNHHLDNLSFMAETQAAAVPEPPPSALLLVAVAGVILIAARRRRTA